MKTIRRSHFEAWVKKMTASGLAPGTVKTRFNNVRAVFRAAHRDKILHDLRHFYASGLIAQGCDVVTVQRALGHAYATTTLNTYSQLWFTAEDRTRKASEVMMGASLGNLADSVRTEAP